MPNLIISDNLLSNHELNNHKTKEEENKFNSIKFAIRIPIYNRSAVSVPPQKQPRFTKIYRMQ